MSRTTRPIAWLLLLPEISSSRGTLRVRIWRRLRELGSVRLTTGAYLLPDGNDEREDFEWLAQEIRANGGSALIARVSGLDGISDSEAIELFRQARAGDYREWMKDLASWAKARRRARSDDRDGLAALRERLQQIEAVDRFPGVEQEKARSALGRMERQMSSRKPSVALRKSRSRRDFQGKLWVTRPGPKVDRLASAWLIRRFIDRRARFRFSAEPLQVSGAIAFDAAGAPFTHRGDCCTFEVLAADFAIEAPSVHYMAEIVHDLDLKDKKFGRLASYGFAQVLEGLIASEKDSARRLEAALPLFDWLAAAAEPER